MANPKLSWHNTNAEWNRRLDSLFQRWQGTKYLEKSQVPQVGVDCVRFSTAILDAMERKRRSKRTWIPADVCFHNAEQAWKAAKAIMAMYWPIDIIRDGRVEAGDMIITGPSNGGPGHSAIVGTMPGSIWHIAGPESSVSRTSVQALLPKGFGLIRIYRIQNREERWLK